MRTRLLAVLFFLVPTASFADYSSSAFWFNRLAEDTRAQTQVWLMFTGHYVAEADAEFGPRTFEALTAFQQENGYSATGVLSQAQYDLLLSRAAAEISYLGFDFIEDQRTGVSLGLPFALVAPPVTTPRGNRWSNGAGTLVVETVLVPSSETSFDALFARLSQNASNRYVEYRVMRDGFFIVSGYLDGKSFYTRFAWTPLGSVGFSLPWRPEATYFKRLAVVMSNSLSVTTVLASVRGTAPPSTPVPARPTTPPPIALAPPTPQVPRTTPAAPSPEPEGDSTGSGFFITNVGHIATAAHVVEGCRFVEVAGYGAATILRADETNDVAVLQLATSYETTGAAFRQEPIRLGDEVLAVGFPLSSIMEDSLTVTEGNVSSLSGLLGDASVLQISAPIQPGNSGGPLLDDSGRVVGIVTSQLNQMAMLGASGTLHQNVNFAVKNSIVLEVLQIAGVEPTVSAGSNSPMSMADVAEVGQASTVQVICRN